MHGRSGSRRGAVAVESIHAGCGGLCRGAGAVGSLVNILAINIDGVGHKGGATVAATGVALLKAEELQLGLDTLKETLAHVCGVRKRRIFVVDVEVCGL